MDYSSIWAVSNAGEAKLQVIGGDQHEGQPVNIIHAIHFLPFLFYVKIRHHYPSIV
jgi:hypothetical protein